MKKAKKYLMAKGLYVPIDFSEEVLEKTLRIAYLEGLLENSHYLGIEKSKELQDELELLTQKAII